LILTPDFHCGKRPSPCFFPPSAGFTDENRLATIIIRWTNNSSGKKVCDARDWSFVRQ
jgi:hypothetical protein